MISGNPFIDIIYIDDAIVALGRLAEQAEVPDRVEIGTGKSTRVIDLANAIVEMCMGASDILENDGELLGVNRCADTTFLNGPLQFWPSEDHEEKLQATLEYYRSHSSKLLI